MVKKTKKNDLKELLDLQKETVRLLKEAVELLKNNVHYHFHNNVLYTPPYQPYVPNYPVKPNIIWGDPTITCEGSYVNSVPVTASHKAEFVTGMSIEE
jgi:hypothetical protein